MIRTLIIDDDFMAVSVHRDFTERVAGFTVVGGAVNGRQGIAQIATLKPDLVLLDMYLPDLSGIDLLRQLRADSRTRWTSSRSPPRKTSTCCDPRYISV